MVDVARETFWVCRCYYVGGSVIDSTHKTKSEAITYMRSQFDIDECLMSEVFRRNWRGGYGLLKSLRHEYEPGHCEM